MTTEKTNSYQGELATPHQICQLADEYRKAAHHLLGLGRKVAPLSRAPLRFAAILEVELYLKAFLLDGSREPAVIRVLKHNLTARTNLAEESRLALRARTVAHLHSMAMNREYLVMRYGPETSRLRPRTDKPALGHAYDSRWTTATR